MRLLGHPLHPMLASFPLALWTAATLWDLLAWWRGGEPWGELAYWSLLAGLVVAVPAAMLGWLDSWRLAPGSAADRVATQHMAVTLVAAAAFGASFWLHRSAPDRHGLHLAVSVAGLAALLVGAWLGGELVFAHGVGVRDGRRGRRDR